MLVSLAFRILRTYRKDLFLLCTDPDAGQAAKCLTPIYKEAHIRKSWGDEEARANLGRESLAEYIGKQIVSQYPPSLRHAEHDVDVYYLEVSCTETHFVDWGAGPV